MHSSGILGTGSGLGTRVLGLLEEEFPEVCRIVTSIYPSAEDDVITSPYNSVLAMSALTEHADCVLPVENQVCTFVDYNFFPLSLLTSVQRVQVSYNDFRFSLISPPVVGRHCEQDQTYVSQWKARVSDQDRQHHHLWSGWRQWGREAL